MKERLQHHLSDVGESFDYLRSDVRNLSRYMAELEELIEGYRAFAATAALSMPADHAALRKLLKKTQKILGPPPTKQPALQGLDEQVAESADRGPEGRPGALVSGRLSRGMKEMGYSLPSKTGE